MEPSVLQSFIFFRALHQPANGDAGNDDDAANNNDDGEETRERGREERRERDGRRKGASEQLFVKTLTVLTLDNGASRAQRDWHARERRGS